MREALKYGINHKEPTGTLYGDQDVHNRYWDEDIPDDALPDIRRDEALEIIAESQEWAQDPTKVTREELEMRVEKSKQMAQVRQGLLRQHENVEKDDKHFENTATELYKEVFHDKSGIESTYPERIWSFPDFDSKESRKDRVFSQDRQTFLMNNGASTQDVYNDTTEDVEVYWKYLEKHEKKYPGEWMRAMDLQNPEEGGFENRPLPSGDATSHDWCHDLAHKICIVWNRGDRRIEKCKMVFAAAEGENQVHLVSDLVPKLKKKRMLTERERMRKRDIRSKENQKGLYQRTFESELKKRRRLIWGDFEAEAQKPRPKRRRISLPANFSDFDAKTAVQFPHKFSEFIARGNLTDEDLRKLYQTSNRTGIKRTKEERKYDKVSFVLSHDHGANIPLKTDLEMQRPIAPPVPRATKRRVPTWRNPSYQDAKNDREHEGGYKPMLFSIPDSTTKSHVSPVEQRNWSVDDFITSLFALAYFMLVLVGLKKFRSFQKSVRRLQEPLVQSR